MSVYGLVLGGGLSLRMKKDKGSLIFDGQTLRQRAFQNLEGLCAKVFISLRPEQAQQKFIEDPDPRTFIFDEVANLGPTAALIAAHKKHPEVTWFVQACDFPLANRQAAEYLFNQFRRVPPANEVVCYMHEDGSPEPLFALWRPQALARLQASLETAEAEPMLTLKRSAPRLIPPFKKEWLIETNTPLEWASLIPIE